MADDKKNYEYERVTFRYNGKKYSAYGRTLAEAHKKSAEKRIALERGEIALSSSSTVKDWSKEWLETYKKGNVTDKTYQGIEHRINDIILPVIGNMKLRDVKDTHLQKILNSRAGYSESHINKVHQVIKGIFKQAYASRLIAFDPSISLTTPKASSGSYRSITAEERECILKTAEHHPAGLWVKTMLYCGLRPGETIALCWTDIDFKKRRINVSRAKESGKNEIKTPKSSAGIRSVPIPSELYHDLEKAKKGRSPFDFVFTQPTTGKMHTNNSIRCYWKSFKRALDIEMGAKVYRNQIILSIVAEDLVPYCLRHTYGTDLQDAGVPINVAKYLMGHSDISTTANIYTDTTEAVINSAAKLVDELHGAKGGAKNQAIC